MQTPRANHLALIDGSRLIVESCVQAGADVYVGYPITPASLIYTYSSQRFPALLPAPDEITVLQWMAGLSAAGSLPVTATSFPGFALMVESLNMAYMMELPMLVVLVQRLGPSTGSATVGAQGDLWLLHGLISGGYPLPVLCISDLEDCWKLPPVGLQTALALRTPLILLTSKEMVMTQADFDLARLDPISPLMRETSDGKKLHNNPNPQASLTPAFLPVGNPHTQVRLNASTHDPQGILRDSAPEALANSLRLGKKIEQSAPQLYDLDEQVGSKTLLVSYGITSGACRAATIELRRKGTPLSLLIARTLLPIPNIYYEIMERYPRVIVAEENQPGQFCRLLFGGKLPEKVSQVTGIGSMLSPQMISEVIQTR